MACTYVCLCNDAISYIYICVCVCVIKLGCHRLWYQSILLLGIIIRVKLSRLSKFRV
jgi:hypothetical protein